MRSLGEEVLSCCRVTKSRSAFRSGFEAGEFAKAVKLGSLAKFGLLRQEAAGCEKLAGKKSVRPRLAGK